MKPTLKKNVLSSLKTSSCKFSLEIGIVLERELLTWPGPYEGGQVSSMLMPWPWAPSCFSLFSPETNHLCVFFS